MIFGFGQVEKYMEMAKERLELSKALVKASERAANPPAPKAKAKASAKAEASPPAIAA